MFISINVQLIYGDDWISIINNKLSSESRHNKYKPSPKLGRISLIDRLSKDATVLTVNSSHFGRFAFSNTAQYVELWSRKSRQKKVQYKSRLLLLLLLSRIFTQSESILTLARIPVLLQRIRLKMSRFELVIYDWSRCWKMCIIINIMCAERSSI